MESKDDFKLNNIVCFFVMILVGLRNIHIACTAKAAQYPQCVLFTDLRKKELFKPDFLSYKRFFSGYHRCPFII